MGFGDMETFCTFFSAKTGGALLCFSQTAKSTHNPHKIDDQHRERKTGGGSEKPEKAGTVDLKKHPARKVGTRSRQCRPKVPGRFAFPGARNPRICCISRFGKIFSSNFPGTFPEFSWRAPEQTPETATAFSSFLSTVAYFASFLGSDNLHTPKNTTTRGRSFVGMVRGWRSPIHTEGDEKSETGRIRFRGVRFQTPNSVSFLGLTEFRGASSVSSSRPIICVPKRTHRVFRRTHRVCRKT